MGLLISKQKLNFEVIYQKCSPLAASMFDEDGNMRVPCSKVALKANLQVQVPGFSEKSFGQ